MRRGHRPMSPTPTAPAQTDRYSWRRRLRMIFPLHTSPRRIALGVSIGVLVAFLPAVGFQMGLAFVIASMFNVSRVGAVTAVWVSNPLTMKFVFVATYVVGSPFWFRSSVVGVDPVAQVFTAPGNPLSIGAVFTHFHSLFSLGLGAIVPMTVGGLILGSAAGAFSYYPAKAIATLYQHARRRKGRGSRANRSTPANTSYDHSDHSARKAA